MNHSDELIIILSDKFIIKEINSVAEKRLGWEKKNVCKKPLESILKNYSMQPILDPNNLLKKTKIPNYILNDNQNLKIDWDLTPIYDMDKKIELLFLRGKCSNELNTKPTEYLKFENLVRYAPGFFYWKDNHGVYQGCNDEFANLAGVESQMEVIGRKSGYVCK
ncbi:MAG: hypothetical protein H0U70_00500 [Tatlockia sp.]|nr:hypothetical protein [Tatlockia sp.]